MNITFPMSEKNNEFKVISLNEKPKPGDELIYTTDNNFRYTLKCQKECNIKWNEMDNQVLGLLTDEKSAISTITQGMWMSLHSAFRSHLVLEDQGGQVAEKIEGVKGRINKSDNLDALVNLLVDYKLNDGDIIVIADKVVSICMNRIIPLSTLDGKDPKFLNQSEKVALAKKIKNDSGKEIDPNYLILIDYLDDGTATLGGINHNETCSIISDKINKKYNVKIDVVISDSDTGVDQGTPIIGFPTIGATPLGATAGLTVYETLRVSLAAELLRGHNKNIPISLVKPSRRNKVRKDVGEPRNYPFSMNILFESEFHRGNLTTIFWEVEDID